MYPSCKEKSNSTSLIIHVRGLYAVRSTSVGFGGLAMDEAARDTFNGSILVDDFAVRGFFWGGAPREASVLFAMANQKA